MVLAGSWNTWVNRPFEEQGSWSRVIARVCWVGFPPSTLARVPTKPSPLWAWKGRWSTRMLKVGSSSWWSVHATWLRFVGAVRASNVLALSVSRALGGHPTSRASARFPPRDDVGARPAHLPVGSSGAGVRPCAARPGSSAANAPSTEPVLLSSPLPYYDLGPTRVLLLSISSELLS